MDLPSDGTYPYIRGYGKLVGSFPYYVAIELRRARESNAPADAYSSKHDSNNKLIGWRCLSDLELDESQRRRIEQAAY